jgi:cell division protein FtsL
MAAPGAAPARTPLRRPVAPRLPRRVSGPSRRRTAETARRRSLLARLLALPDHRLVDRLLRGRVWIPLIGFLLIGIVAMQVSMLKLNAGIGTAVERASVLERQNGELRADQAKAEAGERIQRAASKLGMVMPAPDQVRYLKVKRGHRTGD